jgi:hypothetical protein
VKEFGGCGIYPSFLLANGRYVVEVFLLFFRNVSSDIRNFPFDGFIGSTLFDLIMFSIHQSLTAIH